jgi:hypothetical protein
MTVDVSCRIVAHLYAVTQPIQIAVRPNTGINPAQFPALLIPATMAHLAQGALNTTAASSSNPDCTAVANNLVVNHFPQGYGIKTPADYEGHVWQNERWVPSGGGDFGYTFAITRPNGSNLVQDMQIDLGGGTIVRLRAQFYLQIQRA